MESPAFAHVRMVGPGLLRVGDGPLALGRDPIIAAASAAVGAGGRLAFAEFVPADPITVGDALQRALACPFPVYVCAAGEEAAEFAVSACLDALCAGRSELGLTPWQRSESEMFVQVGNVCWIRAELSVWSEGFARHWHADRSPCLAMPPAVVGDGVPRVAARLAWGWPENACQRVARVELLEREPLVLQRLVRGAAGANGAPGIELELDAPSRTRLTSAQRFLRQRLTPRTSSPMKPGPR